MTSACAGLFRAHPFVSIYCARSVCRAVEMDLDMIQDLLGGTNLPPPPSVQDLLGDVVPVARSPTPPTPPPSQRLTAEHSYSKVATFIIGRLNSFSYIFDSHFVGYISTRPGKTNVGFKIFFTLFSLSLSPSASNRACSTGRGTHGAASLLPRL